MSKITIPIGFYLKGEHYAQMQAFLPRTQALKISRLKIIQTQKIPNTKARPSTNQPQSEKSLSHKLQSQQQNQQDQNQMDIEQQQDNLNNEDQIVQDDQIDEERLDSEKQEENLLQYLQDDDDSDDDLDQDLSSISRSISIPKNNHKTKRQKGQRLGLQQLPDRRPRKDKKLDQATQIIRKEEKQRKRKQYLKKQVQANQKATLDKILNETGRKLKLKQQKQTQDTKRRDEKTFSTLGKVPKIITIENQQGRTIMLHKTELFQQQMTKEPQIKIRAECSKCGSQNGKYKIKNTQLTACSLHCYKTLIC